jgi:hypothetical protein
MSEWTEKAEVFCTKTGTKIKIEYAGNDYYFKDDKEPRDIYRFTIRRGRKSYTGKFGQSIYNTAEGNEPVVYDILSCITKYDPDSLDNFIKDYGYEIHSADDFYHARDTYKAVCREWKGVQRLFGDVMELLQEIE